MDAELEKMLDRVRGLLAKAEDPGATGPEAEALTAKAAELMARYNIDKVMLAAKADMREFPVDKIISFPDPYGKQHMYLYNNILSAFGGSAVIIERRGRNTDITIQVYAFEADLMAVDVLYTSLLLQGIQQSKIAPRYEHARTWRTSFWIGFNGRVYKRLTEAQAEAVKETKTPGTALVLQNRKQMVEAKKFQDHGKLGTDRQSRVRSESGYYAGQRAGDRANLHNQKATPNTRRTALTG